MRCFVGVWPDADATTALNPLPLPESQMVRWVPPSRWHVTLAFLGELPDGGLGPSVDALRATAEQIDEPPIVELGPATTTLGRSVLCIPAVGLEHAAAVFRTAATDAAISFDRTPFRGHLTVARARRRASRIPPELIGVPVSTRWTARELCLIASRNGPQGLHYETLVAVPIP